MALVLVADDHPILRRLLSIALEEAGHEVIEATDGMQALELASSAHPALVLLDWSMPQLTGLAVCRLLRADAKLASIPVIFMTAHNEPAYARAARAAGADDCLVKPTEPDALMERIERVLSARTADAAARGALH